MSSNPDAQDTPALNGLQTLQMLMREKRNPAIGDTLEFRLVEIDEGIAVFEGTPTERVYNPIGTVHGGYAAALLDSACGCAVHSRLNADQAYTTAELKVSYHRALTKETGVVRAHGSIVSMGRRVAFAQARLVDADDRLYASATSTLLVMERRP
ncbi:PaaI family thioesterase [Salinisphaera aquimarina]|uniref:PaaI family thioesterase n=1 Tax=Salinisphaera aquimarina TaxID=2094031 RepID=A0ABV7EP50_9GAMM